MGTVIQTGLKPIDMPELFDALISENRRTLAFPIREQWLDIGRIEDLTRAESEFREMSFLAVNDDDSELPSKRTATS